MFAPLLDELSSCGETSRLRQSYLGLALAPWASMVHRGGELGETGGLYKSQVAQYYSFALHDLAQTGLAVSMHVQPLLLTGQQHSRVQQLECRDTFSRPVPASLGITNLHFPLRVDT